ncbi:MAG: PQQ-binding-like beta-propeller repeat protein [Candidatus Methanomethylophilaceae archaeon]|nr:PQQ-binding-like beta-propeller repeat protein [Candidatus Methanomethylophilaceae archaeon]
MRRFAAVLLVMVLVFPLSSYAVSAEDGGDAVLIDFGNGSYRWYENGGGSTFGEVLSSSVDPAVADQVLSESDGGCSWRLYSWSGGWADSGTDLGASASGTVAFGYYPEGFAPVCTPEYRDAWTTLGGSSSASNVSISHGRTDPAMPVEWYNTYTTGYVDSGLVVAGDMLYHTTGGAYGATGGDEDAWVYALDRFTGAIVWKYHEPKGAGYEVTTPLIVGGYLVVTFTCGDVICFDRFTGEVKDTVRVGVDPPTGTDGDVLWDGRVFQTGGTTPVYDSGLIYFGTSSGTVMALSLSPDGRFSVAWEYVPPSDVGPDGGYVGTRGCFYFHAPTIGTVDGKRMLFIGSYEGYVHALDAATGEPVWVKRVVDMRVDNRAAPYTPGSAAAISLSPDGSHLLVGCTDGALFSLEGYLLALDPSTGGALKDGSGAEWRLDALFTSPVVTESGFYTYVSPLAGGSESFESVDGSEVPASTAVYKFDWDGRVVWKSGDYQMIKGALTLDSDGILYGTDYSAGAFWPTGGGLTAWDSSDGHEIWRVLLSPYTQDSYSMVQPTVIDGRIYTGNDFGAVYCLSDVAGEGTEEERVQSLQTVGFAHWSWYLTIAAVVAFVGLFAVMYRRTLNG